MTKDSSEDITDGARARRTQLEDLIAQATSKYSLKDYNAAAELYSQATELQANTYGEMFIGNADLLYAYGRCLYHVAIRKSDVLGTKVAGEKQPEGSTKPRGNELPMQVPRNTNGDTKDAKDTVTRDVNSKNSGIEPEETASRDGTPYFQFTGDENFEDSDDDEDAEPQDGDDADNADEEDDFANAFEVLDLARVLLKGKLDEEEASGEGKGLSPLNFTGSIKQVKERLADTHDLQAEISLEGERFPDAVADLRAALGLKMELYSEESSVLAEAHFKLSLALEFASVTQQKDEGDSTLAHVDEATREEAAAEMDAAIASCKLRIKMEESRLRAGGDVNETNHEGSQECGVSQQDIDDVKDMVNDMEQRVKLDRKFFPFETNMTIAT